MIRSIFLTVLLTACGVQQLLAADSDRPTSSRTITVVIGNAAGGTTDVVGRLLATSMSAHLPDRPRLVFVNQPGAEGVTSLNSFVRDAKPDGLSITVGAPTQSDPSFYRSAYAKYDLQTLGFIGGVQNAGSALLVNRDALARLTRADGPAVTMGALAALRPRMYTNLFATEFLKWNTRWVLGYANTNDLKLALMRGEIDMTSLGASSDIAEVLRLASKSRSRSQAISEMES